MRIKTRTWLVASLLLLMTAAVIWRWQDRPDRRAGGSRQSEANAAKPRPQKSASAEQVAAAKASPASKEKAPFPYRVTNTDQPLKDLSRNNNAILLRNALIDTTRPLNLAIPEQLRANGDPKVYIVKARQELDKSFYAQLREAGALFVSYIPNNAALVRATAEAVKKLENNPRIQTIIPYHPHYKLAPELLALAAENKPLPQQNVTAQNAAKPQLINPNKAVVSETLLAVTGFQGERDALLAELNSLGAELIGEDRSPFGPEAIVRPTADGLVALAQSTAIQEIERYVPRSTMNDLTRARLKVSANTVTANNYLGLTGSNVLVNINDSGVDATHPDLQGRMLAVDPNYLVDAEGHGTHVAGIIAGDGTKSDTINGSGGKGPPPGSANNANFRGKAPKAKLFVQSIDTTAGPLISDSYLQETAAKTNCLISNNSWGYTGAYGYQTPAASYDAAVRDAVPGTSGSQPMLFVFAAGNDGDGDTSGLNASPDSISSPAAGKNVITVGAIESLRNITNEVHGLDGTTNGVRFFQPRTDSSSEVAFFSSRGNVGVGVEGEAGRFKPDVVAPGVFIVSTRASNWVDPTNAIGALYNSFPDQTIGAGKTNIFPVVVPANGFEMIVQVVPNASSPSPFPDLNIYADPNTTPPTTLRPATNNTAFFPVSSNLWYIAIVNPTNQPVACDVNAYVLITNSLGDYFEVLSNLNSVLAPYYRYETGTSMAAPAVSGVLALMQEYLTRIGVTNPSPALMKALLINGARVTSIDYDYQVNRASANDEGWGLVNISNSIPATMTSSNGPVIFYEQDVSKSLATGDTHTREITVDTAARTSSLRFTLVWTDPPGNPSASLKLVNDLDLYVTNMDTMEVYVGNNFNEGTTFTDTGDVASDIVNNVENVYINGADATLGATYRVAVRAKRVNVNAITTHPDDIVQDYALVISSGRTSSTSALTQTADLGISSERKLLMTAVSNGIPVLNQRVGANSPLISWNGNYTNGVPQQWHFFVFTNTVTNANAADFTNVAFITFLPPNLAVPRLTEADIDLYVSTNSAITNLDPVVLAGADKSTNRGGTEFVFYTNSAQGTVYYCGVKSEDQQAAEFGFIGISTNAPFGSGGGDGPIFPMMVPISASFPEIPDGTPDRPQAVQMLAVVNPASMSPPINGRTKVRRVTVTDSLTHELYGDLFGQLSYGQGIRRKTAVLNNHSQIGLDAQPTSKAYDDNGEGDITDTLGNPSVHTDGPGSLRDFVGSPVLGNWTFTMIDNTWGHTGQVNNVTLQIDPQPQTNRFIRTIAGGGWYYDFVDVDSDTTNLIIAVNYISGSGPVDMFARMGDFPAGSSPPDDAAQLGVGAPGGQLAIGTNSTPSLQPGNPYYYAIHNLASSAITIEITIIQQKSLTPNLTRIFSGGGASLLDDATTRSSILVTNIGQVVAITVGVIINHPRASDLVLHLISPQGTSILLAENRGGVSTGGYGTSILTTNVYPRTSSGDYHEDRNTIDTGQTSGTIIIDFQPFCVPDTLDVYYEGQNILSTGPVSTGCNGTGAPARYTVNYGPGTLTTVTIVVNQGGSTNTTTLWNYTATVVTEKLLYTFFTENTNLASQLFKFAPPPFASTNLTLTNKVVLSNSFENITQGTYTNNQTVDGWLLLTNLGSVTNITNQVGIITDTNLAYTGSNFLALANGHIARLLPTETNKSYLLSYAFRGAGITNWWPADGKANDLIGTNNTDATNVLFLDGQVAKAFYFTNGQTVDFGPNAMNVRTNDFTLEFWLRTSAKYNLMSVLSKRPNCGAASMIDLRLGDSVGNGKLVLELASAGDVNYNVVRATNVVNDGLYHHVALVRKGVLGSIYVDGQLSGTNSGAGIADIDNTASLLLGKSPCIAGPGGPDGTQYFSGELDEVSAYTRALSQAEINAVYLAGSSGKYGHSSVYPSGQLVIDGVTNDIVSNVTEWQNTVVGFTPQTNGTWVEFDGNPLGLLIDSVRLFELPSTNYGNYFYPEESLDPLIGENAFGNWTLEITDDRGGQAGQLVNWQLDITVSSTNVNLIVLTNHVPYTNTLPANSIQYFAFDVDSAANYATNILNNVSGPRGLTLFFNQAALPNGTLPGDYTLLGDVVGNSSAVLSKNGAPPQLQPGQRYFLGLSNPSGVTQSYLLQVDTDTGVSTAITPLTNGIPVSTNIYTNALQYYYFDVDTNASLAAFEILNPSDDVELLVKRDLPLPDRLNFDYISSNSGTNDEAIVILTNSVPVALTPGRWYVGVYSFYGTNTSTNAITYTIRATEITNAPAAPNIIFLTNGLAYTDTNQPGAAFNTFYAFAITNTNASVELVVTNMSGNVDLLVRKDVFPTPQLADRGSFNSGTTAERIVIATNAEVPSLNGIWYLAVPNNSNGPVVFDVRATLGDTTQTNFPLAPFRFTSLSFSSGSQGFSFSWNAERGKQYEIGLSTNLPNFSVLTNITATSSTPSFTDTNPINASLQRFYRLRQLP